MAQTYSVFKESSKNLQKIFKKSPQSRTMSLSRTLTLDYGRTTEVLYVVGTELTINLYRTAPLSATFYSFNNSKNVQLKPGQCGCKHHLNTDTKLVLSMSSASQQQGDGKVEIHLYDEEKELVSAELLLTAVEISLDVDADRDGVVEKNNPNKGSWKWGPGGHGAVLLVNCDSDSGKKPDNEQNFVGVESDLKDMSLMVLRTKGPEKLPEGYRLLLHVSEPDAEGVRVFTKEQEDTYPLVLMSGKLTKQITFTPETTFYVEGVKFADQDFSGLVKIHVSLLETGAQETPIFIETPIFTDTVLFKMAPWIMTPNVLPPLKVYVCSTSVNSKFVEGMEDLVQKAKCELHIITRKVNRGDIWIQDEMEFGYVQAPHQSFPVVLDSPRDRELDNFPYNELLGPDFGYVTRKPPRGEVNSLESFGNLEVSPAVSVNGKSYPLGRIIIGGAFPFQTNGRNLTSAIQNFLRAQAVQEPIALFSDWLLVGHVDEFMSFVPAKDKKGFRLLLASPHAAYKLFQSLQEAGHGQATLFDDVPNVKRVTVDELLANDKLHSENDYFQRCIDWNRDRLKTELGLDEGDIVDVPVLYKYRVDPDRKGAVAFYPDIVNMIVLEDNLGIPKPFGPKVNGQCALEQETTKLMENLGLKCNFIDDFVPYHVDDGDVHCGSNVRRNPFNLKWWDIEM